MKCLILAAGYATRLYPLTENFPKPLLKVSNKAIIDWLIDDINKVDLIDEFIIVSNHKFIDNFNDWKNTKNIDKKITIIDDGSMSNENRLGAVKDIDLAIKKLNINDDLMVIAGDNLLDFSLIDFINYYNKKKCTCIMRYYEENKEKIKKSASVKFDDNDLVLEMIEKPSNPDSNWCVPPFYIYPSDVIKKINMALDDGCNYDAPGSLIAYFYDKVKIYTMKMPGNRYDIGTVSNYENVCSIFDKINK